MTNEEEQRVPILQIDINMQIGPNGEYQTKVLDIYENEDPGSIAHNFVQKYSQWLDSNSEFMLKLEIERQLEILKNEQEDNFEASKQESADVVEDEAPSNDL